MRAGAGGSEAGGAIRVGALPRHPPLLRSPLLTLEPLRADHLPVLFAGLSDPALYRCLADRPPASPDELSDRVGGSGRSPDGADLWCSWMVRQNHDDAYAGTVQATVEQAGQESSTGLIGIMIFPPFWRRGIATEAVSCLLDCLFERYRCAVAAALVDTRNAASLALFARLGFGTVRLILDADFFDGQISHEVELALPRAAWRTPHGTR